MRKIFLFLFAAVLSIGTAMAQTELWCDGVTVSTGAYSIDLNGSWDVDPSGEGDERAITVTLWQDYTQGYGTYQVDPDYGYKATLYNGYEELTPVTTGSYMDMGNGTFVFQATMTNGTTTYEVYLTGSTESSTPETGEMEATDVAVTIEDGTWFAEAYADDYSWSLNLEVADYNGFDNYEVVANYNGTLVFGIGEIFFDEYNGKICFKTGVDGLQSEDGSVIIYPMLYVQTISVMSSNTFPAEASYWEEYGKTGYTMLNLMSDVWNWSLELHVPNFTGAGEYSLVHETYVEQVWDDYLGELVDETVNLYSKLDDFAPLMGDITVYEDEDEGLLSYECYLYTVGMNGQMGTMFNATVFETNAETFDIVSEATVAEGNYPLEFTCEWDSHSVKVEVTEVKYNQPVWANIIFDGGIINGGDQAEGEVVVTKNGDIVTVEGTLESWGSGNIFNVTLYGTLPAGILETVVFADGEDYTDLLAQYAGQKVNAQVERMLLNDGLNTLTLPFDIAASQIGNIKAYQITSVVENRAEEIEIVCTEKTTLLAGQPYIIEVLGRSIWAIEANGVVIKNVSPSNVVAKGKTTTVTMHGVLNTTGETTNGLYWIGDGGYLYNDDVDKLGLRAYFSITTSTGIAPRMRVVTSENAATGLDNITTSENATKAIVNGQLVIIRDGEMYNVQGQKL